MLREILRTLRPQQWIKNLFIFAPLIFSQNFFRLIPVLKTTAAFILFCLTSGAVYILNDIRDMEEDRLHPLKSKRPLASGKLEKKAAVTAFVVLTLCVLGSSFLLSRTFLVAVLTYFLLQVAYSFWLKHVVILDVFIVAGGFFIRVIAGALVIAVFISPWLLICTILLALFLSLGKRRHELVLLDAGATQHRPILREYNPYLLDQMISVVTASTVISYCLYTIAEETVAKFGTNRLLFTVPFVLYGIFRYLYLIHQKSEGGTPESLIITDRPLLAAIFLWIATAVVIVYFAG